ncbi:MFS transporter prlL [Colletotrichum spaethianum]|uniref:MFS transporter prlL n=1 Tax=Colletotrichum spaethianum TaxID=700344 RepID=A0AA37LH65_9PEZI|nr:MFS transporter prlL [Colletotrichum spaethianum]GKT46244.1 MFS transporter prlL [Colletotrichum spaethianum]
MARNNTQEADRVKDTEPQIFEDENPEKPIPRNTGRIDYSGAQEKTDPKEIALVKKLDRWIMPMLWSMYWLNGTMMMLWAVVSALTAVSKDFTGLLLTRFFLGLTEAPYYPGAVYLLSIFYTRKEVATRIAILYTGNILATAFAGLIAAGIFHGMDDLGGLAGWKWLFILQGAVTFVIAVIGFFLLPDFPQTTKWLTQEERDLAYNRMELDTVGNKGETSIWNGLRQAAADPMVWIFCAMAHMHLAANGFKNFFPTVVETLGFNTTITLVLTCPPYLIAGAVTIAVSWSSGKYNERTWHITISKAVAVVGFVSACATLDVAGRYASMVIFTIGTYGVNSLILGWCGSVCGQTKEKKAAAISAVTMIMNISFIWTPYLWPSSDEPRYVIAMSSSAAFSIATAALAWVAKIIMKRRNAKLRASNDETTVFYVY